MPEFVFAASAAAQPFDRSSETVVDSLFVLKVVLPFIVVETSGFAELLPFLLVSF